MAASKITVVGTGTWGITLACLLHKKGCGVCGWDFAPEVVEKLKRERGHPKLPWLQIPSDLELTTDLEAAVQFGELWVVVVPSHGVRAAFQRLKERGLADGAQPIVVCSKGIEQKTCMIMTEVIVDVLGESARPRLSVLSGPSHAEEVSREIPTTVCAAANEPALAERIQELFMTPRFRVYTQDDIMGVELGASLKNVIAIAAGVCDGLGFGDNAKAALITRGLAEMTRLGVAMGAKPLTFSGLAGMGDLIVTATSRHSRNRNFGELLARGKSPDEAQREIGMVVEGVRTADSACALAQRHGVEMPITEQVYALLHEGATPAAAAQALMLRDPKPEQYR